MNYIPMNDWWNFECTNEINNEQYLTLANRVLFFRIKFPYCFTGFSFYSSINIQSIEIIKWKWVERKCQNTENGEDGLKRSEI